jgi:hypothetical protein
MTDTIARFKNQNIKPRNRIEESELKMDRHNRPIKNRNLPSTDCIDRCLFPVDLYRHDAHTVSRRTLQMAEAWPSNNCHPYSTYLNLSSEALTEAGSPAPRHAPSITHQGSMVSLHLQTSCTGVGGCLSHCTSSPAAQGWAVACLTAPQAQLHRGGRLLVSLHPKPSFTGVGGYASLHPQPSCTGVGGYWSHCTPSPVAQGRAATGLPAPPAQLHRGGWLLVSLHPQPSFTGVSGYT